MKSKVPVIPWNHKSKLLCTYELFKQRSVDQTQIKNPEDIFFLQIRLYYVHLHVDDVMTESWLSCQFDRRAL